MLEWFFTGVRRQRNRERDWKVELKDKQWRKPLARTNVVMEI